MSLPVLQPPSPFRAITRQDDLAMASLIRDVMTAEGLSGAGYSINDPEVDAMHAAYAGVGAQFVAAFAPDGQALGGGGVAHLEGATSEVGELRKMYFRPALRGAGHGKRLLTYLIELAWTLGYSSLYLESKGHLEAALTLYRQFGFQELKAPLGATGHSVCDVFMVLER